jgi:hypothetical protein
VRLKITFFLILIGVISCQTKQENNTNLLSESPLSNDPLGLVAVWMLNSTWDGTQNILCNACPTIEFQRSGTAVITYPTGAKRNFYWTTDGPIFIISGIDNSSELLNGKYDIAVEGTTKFTKLKLTRQSDKYYFQLTKTR